MWRKPTPSSATRNLIGTVTLIRQTFNEGVALTPNLLREIADWAPQTFYFDRQKLHVRRKGK